MSDCDCDEVLVAVTLCVTDPVAASEPDTHCVAEAVRVTLGVSDEVADRNIDALLVSDACDGLPDSV